MDTYSLYGLQIGADFPLPFKKARAGNGGVHGTRMVQIAHVSEPFAEVPEHPQNGQWYRRLVLSDGSDYLRWKDLLECVVSPDGRKIRCRRLGKASDEAFGTYLFGQVLSYSLLKFGVEPLHCTTLVLGGEAFGILGDSGYGKSTLAGQCLQMGCRLLTDDMLILANKGGRFTGYPGPSRIKLVADSTEFLFGNKMNGTPMNPLGGKFIFPLTPDQYHAGEVQVKAFYALKPPWKKVRSGKVSITHLSPQKSFVELTKNTFNPGVMDSARLKRQFEFAAGVAASIPMKLFSYPRDFKLLSLAAKALLGDFSG